MQNPHLGSKIKIPKKQVKVHSTKHLQLFCVKNTLQKNNKNSRNETILKISHHAKSIVHEKILTLGKKLKFPKTCQNPFYKSFTVVLCKKPAPKSTKYSRNETITKIGHHAKVIAHAKSSVLVKN